MTYHFVTSYSNAQYDLYAKDMVASFYESMAPYVGPITALSQSSGKALMAYDPELTHFLTRWEDKQFAQGIQPDGSYEYRHMAIRFAFKVFAYTDPNLTEGMRDGDWLIWVDADTKFTAPITIEWLRAVCPEGAMGSYIGRKDWDHSECGWIAFSMADHGREFLEKMRLMYTQDLLFGLPQWHDSYVFDVVRQSMELKYGRPWFNLAEGIGGNHPWPETRLGEVIEHYKGPVAKKEKFGAVA